MKVIGSRSRSAHIRALSALCGLGLALSFVRPVVGQAAALPTISISGPTDGHVFQPGETLKVVGSASSDLTIAAVKLEYWLANRLARRVLAQCSNCGSFQTSWSDAPTSLTPGYYVVKAYSYDQAGNQSNPAQRSFVEGLDQVPPAPTVTVPPSPAPGIPGTPIVTTPSPGSILPGAGGTKFGGSATPGTTVTGTDPNAGKLFTVQAGRDGSWSTSVTLPDGLYRLRTQATNDSGHRSYLSKAITFTVDAKKPTLQVLTQNLTTFLPTEPVILEGKFFDNHHIAAVTLRYWLLDKLAAADLAKCVACSTQEGVWQDQPNLPYPGYYDVQITAFDSAGNASYMQTTTIISTV